jgi:hypothetical protein
MDKRQKSVTEKSMANYRLYRKIALWMFLFLCALLQEISAQAGLSKLTNGQLVRDGLRVKVITRDEADILYEPARNSRVVRRVETFKILNVFSANPTEPQLRDGEFYRVGVVDDPLGWMHEGDVLEWNHRQCLKLTPRGNRPLAKVYKTSDLEEVISQEAKNSTPEDKYFPILEKPKTIFDNGELLSIYHVAYLHGGSTAGSSKARSLMDIVFVIDTTQDMQPYIDGVKQVMEELATEVSEYGEHGQVRFGLVAYRDRVYQPEKMEYVVNRLSPLTPDLNHFVRILAQTQVAKISSNEKIDETAESMYDGVYKAITESDWQDSARRVIILIGDASAHEPGDEKNVNNYSSHKLHKLIQAGNIRVEAIQIYQKGQESDFQRHKAQLEVLTQRQPDSLGGGTRHTVRLGQTTFINLLRTELKKKLELMKELRELAKKDTSTNMTPSPPPGVSTPEWVQILEAVKREGEFAFSSGWLREFIDGKRLVETRVMMTRNEMGLLLMVLFAATTVVSNPTESLIEAAVAAVERHTGEEFPEDFATLAQRQGLPIKAGLLKFSPQDVLDWSQARTRQQLSLIEQKRSLLADLYDRSEEWKNDIAFVPIEYLP